MVQLIPMAEATFADYLAFKHTDYAADNVRAGRWTAEEAPAKAREHYAQLLPQGVHTPQHHFFTVHTESGEKVGVVWLAERPNHEAWLYHILIDLPFRRRGYAQAAFEEIEAYAKSLGLNKIGLNVFGYNQGAYALYQKLGYAAISINMSKNLE